MELKEATKALYDWADESKQRAVLCIATERTNETEEGYNLSTSSSVNGTRENLVNSLVTVMKEDKNVASVIREAFLKHTVKHSAHIGVGIINLSELIGNAGKEGDNE